MQNLRMTQLRKLESLSPELFLFGCASLFLRDFGATLTTSRARFKAMFPIIILGMLAIVFCDHFLIAQTVASLICSAFIWLTFDKKENNLPDRIATQVARSLLPRGLPILTVIFTAPTKFPSRALPTPFIPPRAIA